MRTRERAKGWISLLIRARQLGDRKRWAAFLAAAALCTGLILTANAGKAQAPGGISSPATARGQDEEGRQALANDTAKLLQLATELKKEVDRTNKNVLSVTVIERAGEIEKLAGTMKKKLQAQSKAGGGNAVGGFSSRSMASSPMDGRH